jgi:hypothetical protein
MDEKPTDVSKKEGVDHTNETKKDQQKREEARRLREAEDNFLGNHSDDDAATTMAFSYGDVPAAPKSTQPIQDEVFREGSL